MTWHGEWDIPQADAEWVAAVFNVSGAEPGLILFLRMDQ